MELINQTLFLTFISEHAVDVIQTCIEMPRIFVVELCGVILVVPHMRLGELRAFLLIQYEERVFFIILIKLVNHLGKVSLFYG